MNFGLKCFCGEDDYKLLFNTPFQHDLYHKVMQGKVLQCKKCGLARTYPLPFEDDATADIHQLSKVYEKPRIEGLLEKGIITSNDAITISYIRKFKKEGKLLDIGCGSGHFMGICNRMGFDSEGVEVDKFRADYAIKKLKLKVYKTDFISARIPDKNYDLITVIHVLEHVVSLKPFLEQARKKLEKNGVIIISLPNFGGLMPKLLKGKWYGLQLDGHVWQFTPGSLRKVIEDSGFKVISTEIKSLDHSSSNKIMNYLKKALFGLVELTGMGDNLFMAAVRKD